MSREYPPVPVEALPTPPRAFVDRQDREITVTTFGVDPSGEPLDRDAAVEALVEMYLAFDPADRAQGIPPSDESDIRSWLDSILDPPAVNVVAWHGNDAVGHATLVPDRTGAYELAIFVLDTHQEAGIGTHLIEALLGAGQAAEVERVWLTVEPWNRAAIGLYQKVGFEPSNQEGFELEMSARLT